LSFEPIEPPAPCPEPAPPLGKIPIMPNSADSLSASWRCAGLGAALGAEVEVVVGTRTLSPVAQLSPGLSDSVLDDVRDSAAGLRRSDVHPTVSAPIPTSAQIHPQRDAVARRSFNLIMASSTLPGRLCTSDG
jgi:hypothetical protein